MADGRQMVSLRMKPSALEAVDELAAETGVDRSSVLREAFNAGFDGAATKLRRLKKQAASEPESLA